MPDFDQIEMEHKWQDWWEREKIYHFDPDSTKPPFVIDNPPRYASGPLHLGHAVHYTHIDFAARYNRMKGFNVMFPLCFDVNGMPIEVNVEKKYGIKMREYDRQEFIKLCSDFANANIGEMTRQFKILGESMDPSTYYQTDAEYYRRLTQISFVKLHKQGLIYQDTFPVNWCPRCGTALAEAECEYQDRTTKLNTILFKRADSDETYEIATTRPELLCTCQMVAIHPDDPRAPEMEGKELITPAFGKKVKIFTDDKVEMDFGSGLVMICTIGDKEDLNWVFKYDLPMEKGIDENGNMTELAGKYEGMNLEDARKQIIEDLKASGELTKQVDLEQNVGSCWRCKAPIEFLQVNQWFLKIMDFKEEVRARSDEVNWFPEYMKIRLEEWIDSLSWDWVISRQRYFATPIPIWLCEDPECDGLVVAREEDCYVDPTIQAPPEDKCPKCGGPVKGSEEVFDTWMDSSLSALYCGFWQRDEDMFKKFYPVQLRPQSHDIIRTWAFYTLLRSHLLNSSKPWDNIMMGGFIMAEDGTPMHASKGNAIDPLAILENDGGDAIRYYASNCSLGKDHAFRSVDVKRGRQLTTKYYNLCKLISSAFKDLDAAQLKEKGGQVNPADLRPIDKWILTKYSKTVKVATEENDNYRFEKARAAIEDFMWHDLADNYIEMCKYRIYQGADDGLVYTLYNIGLGITKMLGVYFPHITEEIYQTIYKDSAGDKSVHISLWPQPLMFDQEAVETGDEIREMIAGIRNWKSSNRIALGAPIELVEIIAGDKEGALAGSLEDIKETLKAQTIGFAKTEDLSEKVSEIKPVFSKIGPEFKGDAKTIIAHLKEADPEAVHNTITNEGSYLIELDGKAVKLGPEYMEFGTSKSLQGKGVESIQIGDYVVLVRK